jgi:hypothetical protein
VSSCRSYSRAKGPGTSVGAFPTALISLSGEGPRGPRRGRVRRGPAGPPRTPCVSSSALEEDGPSLIDCNICMVVVWWYRKG